MEIAARIVKKRKDEEKTWMMLSGGDLLQLEKIKTLSIKDYINKFSMFVDKIVTEEKNAEIQERNAKKKRSK